jgi:hypothetical protein
MTFWRRERDSNPRCPVRDTTVFETVPFNHSGTSPGYCIPYATTVLAAAAALRLNIAARVSLRRNAREGHCRDRPVQPLRHLSWVQHDSCSNKLGVNNQPLIRPEPPFDSRILHWPECFPTALV